MSCSISVGAWLSWLVSRSVYGHSCQLRLKTLIYNLGKGESGLWEDTNDHPILLALVVLNDASAITLLEVLYYSGLSLTS